ncbi:MAG: lipocalin family protein [Rikenellaceae bacterium]
MAFKLFITTTIIVIVIIGTVTIAATSACNLSKRPIIDRTTVSEFDINRYLGDWYEIARFDNRFERNLEYVTACYTLMENGKIKVENKGYNTISQEWSTAIGKAKFTKQVGKLRVSFFWIFYSDYNILALGDSGEGSEPYTWTLVGSKSSKLLWILARTPSLDDTTLNKIKDIATSRGYDVAEFLWVESKL